jgi:hypothetical protein
LLWGPLGDALAALRGRCGPAPQEETKAVGVIE